LHAIRADVGRRPICVIVATGGHRWDSVARTAHERPLREAVGEPTRFAWHDGAVGPHVAVGPARLHAAVARARDVIGVGSVEPHWFAGFTGAHKTLTVGVMKRDDIEANHRHALDRGSAPCRLKDNPVHAGFVRVLEALQTGRRVVTLNHVGRRWFAGPPLECLAAASSLAAKRWRRTAERPFSSVIAVVRPPLSRTLYQAEKGIKNTETLVPLCGTMLLDADCEGGVGPDRFVRTLLAYRHRFDLWRAIEQGEYRLGDHKAYRLRALQSRRVSIGIVSKSLSREFAASVGFHLFPTREAAAARWFHGPPRGRTIAVVHDAGNLVAELVR
jgi:nickel-dependent lactate racemase